MAPKYDDHFAAKAQSSADPVVADDPADEVEWLAERQPGDRDDLGDVDGHRISTWGGPGAGKSTFLAALNRAALTATGDSIGWTLAPADPASAAYLAAA